MEWFKEKRFGMFIHWGMYAVPGIQEQYWQRWNLRPEQYVPFADEFNPQGFNPTEWLDIAQEAGMEYLCFTTKHHDGYCMWDTRQTDFNIMNSPYGKDTLAMLAQECHKRNFPLMLYYSVVDWRHPAYPNLGRHHEIVTPHENHDMFEYMDFIKKQVRELCSNYGKIHGFWWDQNVPKHKDPSVNKLIRELQPGIMINNRGFDAGDFTTPERHFHLTEKKLNTEPDYLFVEACQGTGVNSWGYRKDEDYFHASYFKKMIDTWLAKGCNYLLNVGPDANGVIPPESCKILCSIGKWFKPVRESFDAMPEKWLIDESIFTLRDGENIYLHCPDGLSCSTLTLKPVTREIEEAVLLNGGKRLSWTYEPIVYERGLNENYLRLRNLPEVYEPAIIRLKLKVF